MYNLIKSFIAKQSKAFEPSEPHFRRRERKLSTEEYRNAKASVLTDVDDVTVIGITEEVIAQGVALLEQFSLRSADALHIACASEWSTDLFVSPTTVSVKPRDSAV
jgi:predicted nucleic acid-binding protein